MKNQTTSRPVTPPGDAKGGKSVEIERFSWVNHAKARGIASPEYLGCGDAWDVAPSRGAHVMRPATVLEEGRTVALRTHITRGEGDNRRCEVQTVHVIGTVAHLPEMPQAPEYPPLWRSSAQRAILARDRAEYAQLKASGRVHKLPTKAKRARPREGGLVSKNLEDFATPTTPAIGAGRITPPRAIGARGGWCAEYARPRTVGLCDRGPARYKRVKHALCHARRVKRVTCVAHTMHTDATRKGFGTISAALPLTPHLVRAIEGVSVRRDVMSRIAAYATTRGWQSVRGEYDTAQTAPAPSGVPAPTAPVGPRIIPADMAYAKGIAKRKHAALGPAPTPLLLTRETED